MNLKEKTSDNVMASSNSIKHPKVSEMVLLAIAMLNDRNGSSVAAIKKYITNYFNVEANKLSTYIKKYLLMAVASGTLIKTKGKGVAGSFRLGGAMKMKMSELLSKVPNETVSSNCRRKSTPMKNSKKSKSSPNSSKPE